MTPISIPRVAARIAAVAALFIVPLAVQAQDRPSRGCMQEIRALCASDGSRDRSRIRACLRERIDELSDDCAQEVRARAGAQRGERRSGAAQTAAPESLPVVRVARTVIYGAHQRQQVNIYEPEGAVDDAPLILFVHGGGWSRGDNTYVQSKPAYFTSRGYFFGSAGYRLLPNSPVEQQAADIGAAIQAMRGQAASIGFDPERIVLMGHSSGAHLAALVASNPDYAGDAFEAIRGVVLLDGGGYDIAAHIADAGPQSYQRYTNVFGFDPARQSALSPLTHVGGSDAPHWLALYVGSRDIARDQAQALVNALISQGAEASALPIAGTDHSRMTREMGTPAGAAQTEAVDAFLEVISG